MPQRLKELTDPPTYRVEASDALRRLTAAVDAAHVAEALSWIENLGAIDVGDASSSASWLRITWQAGAEERALDLFASGEEDAKVYFARFPGLRAVFLEAGLSWLPHLMLRMDKEYNENRRDVPFYTDRVSKWVQRQVWVGTQPIETTTDPRHLDDLIRIGPGVDHVLYGSNWPAADHDPPGRVAAAHDVSEGGLLVAISEMLFSAHKTFGADLNLLPALEAAKAAGRPFRLDALLFGESQGRIVLAVKPEYQRAVLRSAETAGVPAVALGEGQGEAILKVVAPGRGGEGSVTVTWPVGKLRETWTDAIPKAMNNS